MTSNECDVIVIGAGLSGLTAAYHLKKKDPNLHLLVLEAKDRVGGRTVTVPLKSADGTDYWDLGGQWVGRSQPHIMWLLEELQLNTYLQYTEGKKFMQLGDEKIRTYISNIPTFSLCGLLDLFNFANKINKMASLVSVEDPWSCPHAAEWDAMTLETYKKKTIWTKAVSDLIDAAGRTILGMESSQISLLFYLTYVSGAGGLKNLTEAGDYTGQEMKIKGGLQQVSRKLVVNIGGENIRLGEPVLSVAQTGDNVSVTTVSGVKYHCQKLIMAVPPTVIGKISFRPDLPAFKREVIRHMQPGSVVKVIITYQKAFWRHEGFSGEILTNGGPSPTSGCSSSPLCVVYDSTSANDNPALVAFIGGYQAVEWMQRTATERKQCVLVQLSTFLGDEVFEPLQYIEKDWSTEPYSEGGPVCAMAPGSMQYFSRGLREPIDRIHFAGTESATVWFGFLNGAIQSGLRAATEVLMDLRPQTITADDLKLCKMSVPNRFDSHYEYPWWKILSLVAAASLVVSVSVKLIRLKR
ncbi:probable flavin-containing monoamine oxidase A [Gigantopelta aegis]|uniref:probable flavin-containing monoamine oxidase A n=1 Tax=Gigantopelta aegis TaxID=1735272 RepID=UPI001B887E66|nr:probable flavin-containing monoamine oxidase A [Gigantopelta aegis]